MASPGSATTDTGRSIEATELECLWECRDDCEPGALAGGLCVEGARRVSLPPLSLCRRRPKNLPAEDCLPLSFSDVLEGIVCYALRRLRWAQGRAVECLAFVLTLATIARFRCCEEPGARRWVEGGWPAFQMCEA